ncbi:hypothetical protein DSO57_1034980 [Entomophthora muscae]|uniref:Uncharacterized protein n=1 Tax=Entomophthora muscae TaxID=34485 RepID=A0ACC2UJY3_9FUNG|nr:hypothetical protein DSO57_1034980 [Entomophthora muscae]
MGNNPSCLLQLPTSLLISGEALVNILTCNDLDLYSLDHTLFAPLVEEVPTPSPPLLENEDFVPPLTPKVLVCAPWLLTGLVLMGLNAYFSQLSLVSSLWSPLREAVPVICWVASWWLVSPRWEPNLVSLAPFSHSYITHLLYQMKSVYF